MDAPHTMAASLLAELTAVPAVVDGGVLDSAAAALDVDRSDLWDVVLADTNLSRVFSGAGGLTATELDALIGLDPESHAGPVRYDTACRVAWRDDLQDHQMRHLAASPSDLVRCALAESASTLPADVAQRLAVDLDPEVREALAARSDLPAGVARRLAADPDRDVREVLAGNTHISPEVRATLAADRDARVTATAVQHHRSHSRQSVSTHSPGR